MSRTFDFGRLVDLCRRTHEETRRSAARAVDTHLVTRNWLFGWYIVEYEQRGADRGELYGKKLIERLSGKLRASGLKGCSPTNLRKFRELYRAFPEIQQTLSVESVAKPPAEIRQAPSVISPSPASGGHTTVIGQAPSGRSTPPASDARTSPIGPTPPDRFASPLAAVLSRPLDEAIARLAGRFSLGWSHYVTLLTICRAEERAFYEIEAGWFARLRSAGHGGEGEGLTRRLTAWIMVPAKRYARPLPTLKQVVDAFGAKVGGCIKKSGLELA